MNDVLHWFKCNLPAATKGEEREQRERWSESYTPILILSCLMKERTNMDLCPPQKKKMSAAMVIFQSQAPVVAMAVRMIAIAHQPTTNALLRAGLDNLRTLQTSSP
ncbi:hypothetical protein ElyMa_003246600 [Elysia marginata]|uniref:Uncharacterized protein n=1 Tax=Elysia marginata TaxID=1093978 RepID=A0AAV4J8D2_9GAST|nr:hypothetical protein ElyMa_003246600 [Elysia marginata]